MINVSYDQHYNAVIVEFQGKVDVAQGEQHFFDIEKAIPKHGKGFNLLVDLSSLAHMDPKVRGTIKKVMELFNAQGVTKVIRVVPDPTKDIGFNIMSVFHYSSHVKILTVQSREEAQARLMASVP